MNKSKRFVLLMPFALGGLLALLTASAHAWQVSISECQGCSTSARAVVVDAAGDIIAAGDFHNGSDVVKLSGATGQLIWRFNASSNGVLIGVSDLTIDSKGDVFAVSSVSLGVTKISGLTGKRIWVKPVGGSSSGCQSYIAAVVVDRDDNVVTAGTAGCLFNVAKLDGRTGDEKWHYEREGLGKAVAVDAFGDVAAAGIMNRNFATVKLRGASGEELWQREITGVGDFSNVFEEANAVAMDKDGSVVVAGATSNGTGNFRDFTVAKYLADGRTQWVEIVDGQFKVKSRTGELLNQSDDIANAVVIDKDGGVIAAGSIQSEDDIPVSIPAAPQHFHVVKIARNGGVVWSKPAQEPPLDGEHLLGHAFALSVNASGNVVAVGVHDGRFTLVKFWGRTGGRAWRRQLASGTDPMSNGNDARDVVMDAASDVVAAGETIGADGFSKFTVVKLQRKDGLDYYGEAPPLPFPTPDPSLTPVIFIPGTAGSRLNIPGTPIELWPGIHPPIPPNLLPVIVPHDSLGLDPESPPCPLFPAPYSCYRPKVDVDGVIRDPISLPLKKTQIYKPLLDAFRQAGYAEDSARPTLFVFPYDWRKSNAVNATLLRDKIVELREKYSIDKVNIVTHSMGGVLARRYILDNPDPKLHHVDKLITIAAPWLGAPKAVNAMETGEFLDFPIATKDTVKKLLEFFPSAHELLPSKAYFDLGGDRYRPFQEEWDINQDGQIQRTPYEYWQLAEFINGEAGNFNARLRRSKPYDTNHQFHTRAWQDNWRGQGFGVSYYHLYGVKLLPDTIGKVVARKIVRCIPFTSLCRPIIFFDVIAVAGDKTVPELSATRIGTIEDYNVENAILIEFRGGAEVDHLGLTKNRKVQAKVFELLRQPPLPFTNLLNEKAAGNRRRLTQDTELQQAYYLQIGGAASATLMDEAGDLTHPLGDVPNAGLPDVTSYLLGEDTFLSIMPTDDSYTLTFVTGESPVAIDLTKGTDVETSQAIRYLDLNLPANTSVRLEITPEGVGELYYDSNSDGTFDTPISPIVSVSGSAAQDTEPPVITFTEVPHTTTRLITLTASDSESGVKAIYYSTDGSSFRPYTSPFNIDPHSNPVVYAFADDNVANRSSLTTYQLTAPPSTLQFGAASYSFNEGDGRATITVTRIGDPTATATVEFQTVDDPAAVPCDPSLKRPDGSSYPQGNAYARCDYATSIETVTFAAGDTQPKIITIPLIDDGYVEGTETVQLKLLNSTGATLSAQNTISLTITDNDSAVGLNPIFSTTFFVRMHYLDFLSREPEPGEPWSGVLNRCPLPFNLDARSPSAACDRIIVSQSFFGSPEFRLKGFFVFNFYRVAFDRRPEYAEIIPDMSGVTGATAAEVYAKRAALAVNFTGRAEFKTRYNGLSDTDYVNALLDRYGLQQITTPDPQQPEVGIKVVLTRVELVNRLGAAGAQALTRAQVLRAIVESDEVGAAEYKGVFVAMQYYGYLRRTPEESGYQAWLRVITEDPNNIRIMVNGFMNSTEYRLRFGQP
jgi:pimeloyl-ACP methyl ester carboxylesterase/outer membrane protein assembly factor BamB